MGTAPTTTKKRDEGGYGDPNPTTASPSHRLVQLGAPGSTQGTRDAPGQEGCEMPPDTSSCRPGAACPAPAGREEASGHGAGLPTLPAPAGYSMFISRAFYLPFLGS